MTMRRILWSAFFIVAGAGLGCAGPLSPAEALDRFLTRSALPKCECREAQFAVQVEAALPSLHKQGSMSGFKVVTRTGQTAYRGLHFTGDDLVKKAVIARFLARDTAPPENSDELALTPRNYVFTFVRTADSAVMPAHVFRLKPRRKSVGLFRGELWVDVASGAPLRIWGEFVKSPSIFLKKLRFVSDYDAGNPCSPPARLSVTAQTRIAGEAILVLFLHPIDSSVLEDKAVEPSSPGNGSQPLSDSKGDAQRNDTTEGRG
jgi:hypothetical protein